MIELDLAVSAAAWLPRRRLAARRSGELRVVLRPASSDGQPGRRPVHAGLQRRLGLAALPRPGLLGAARVPARRLVHDPGRLRRARAPRSSWAMPARPALVVARAQARRRGRADRDHGRQPGDPRGPLRLRHRDRARARRPASARSRRRASSPIGWSRIPFPKRRSAGRARWHRALVAARSWTALAAEPTGLVDLARVNGIRDGRDTVLARATLHAEARGGARARARLQRPRDRLSQRRARSTAATTRIAHATTASSAASATTTRSSCPLVAGDNDLVVAVSEDFGGWGVQARLADG